MDELSFLRKENEILKQKQWARKSENRFTRYFFLVDTKIKPNSFEERQRTIDYIDEIMREFKIDLGTLIIFNKKNHTWALEFIDNIKIRYVVEEGPGKIKKNGQLGSSGGKIHIHIDLSIWHKSNITLDYAKLRNWFKDKLTYHLGVERPFISHPRLVHENQIEEYMSKSFYRLDWKKVD